MYLLHPPVSWALLGVGGGRSLLWHHLHNVVSPSLHLVEAGV